MGFIDKLRRAGGIVKNRLASSVGALRTQLAGVRVRIPARIGRLGITGLKAARLTTPLGIGITAATFAPQILRGGRVVAGALARGIAFVGGRQVVTAAGAGGIVGVFAGRRKGEVTRPSDVVQAGGVRVPREARARRRPRRFTQAEAERRFKADRARGIPASGRRPRRRAIPRVRRIPTHRHRVISVPTRRRAPRRRATHRRPRHRGHKRVSFTTAEGKKVSFLANPKARHR